MKKNDEVGADKEDAPGQNKEFTIYVNSKPKKWSEKQISYVQVVVLAGYPPPNDPNIFYTVTFKKGDNQKPEGTMVKGDIVKVKNEMKFNVTQTNRS
ncbi:MAG: multiubiquitin domain-containing protein [Cyclobacteriaceae bacterium]|nr:multiubiquitin domain-containing protein [Cyclobacteriaceae bacterium]